jgi:hypothetical protein
MNATVKRLSQIIDLLPDKDQAFARDLVRAADQGQLSDRQGYWVGVLVRRVDCPAPTIGNLEKVLSLFDKASKNLRFPAFVLKGPDGTELRLSIAGAKARAPGTINVSENKRHGEGLWFGRISRDGKFQSGRDTAPEWLLPLLERFAKDPAAVAAEFGHLTGRCCFCSIKLKDDRSTAVGYGKACAEHWGLFWGAGAAKRAQTRAGADHDAEQTLGF